MNASTILMIIEIIKLIQAMQKNETTTLPAAVIDPVIENNVEGTPEEKAQVISALKGLDLSFIGDVLGGLFGKK